LAGGEVDPQSLTVMFEDFERDENPPTGDPVETTAREGIRAFFNTNRQRVFFSRQLEVQHEDRFFHWITNRAIRDLESEGLIESETRGLASGGTIKLLWHKSFRYYKREAARLVDLVEQYSASNIGGALGLQAEALVLEGFASIECTMKGRDKNEYQGRSWTETEHNVDFIFELDNEAYGVEVKNTLGYMDRIEFETKIRLCRQLNLRPVFAVRMLPKSWIHELNNAGGFALILKYQLYPWTHRDLAKLIKSELGLPVDAPRRLYEGTMMRFLRWHQKL
jgi:hypothetical protein